ncbi:MAG TPA: TGS domain-containing protein, partial [Candidatus Acetothermia bacterium]|nr:TGS domain-containing protein [Candidatus Acetothermia bacterium]
MIHISLPDGSKLEVAPGASLLEVAGAIGPGLAKAAVCALVDGTLRDLREQVNKDATVTFFTRGSQEALSVLRHTTTHIMAQAVKRLFPQAQLGIGPAIEDGFYYDFGVDQPFTPEQLALIEEEMRKIIASAYPIE